MQEIRERMAAAGMYNPEAPQKAQAQLAWLIRDEIGKFVPQRPVINLDPQSEPPSEARSQTVTKPQQPQV